MIGKKTAGTAASPLFIVLSFSLAMAAALVLTGCPPAGTDDPATVAVTGVTLDASTATVNMGCTRQLTATVAPADATDATVSWSSSDASVATVDSAGLVTSVAVGTATVTVTATDGGYTAACAVTVREPDVYVGGCWGDSPAYPGYWKNGVWQDLAPSTAGKEAQVYAIHVQDGVVYAAGYCRDSSDIDIPGYWKAGTWTPLPTTASGKYGYAESILIIGSDVYVAGSVEHATESHKVGALWKNGVLTIYPIGTYPVYAEDVAVSGSDAYVVGYYYDTSIFHAGYWKNGAWNALAPLVSGYDAAAMTLIVNGTGVIAAGWSSYGAATSTPRAVTWTNGAIAALDTVVPWESQAHDMVESGGSLFTAGFYNMDNDSPDLGNYACYWKDGALTILSKPEDAGLNIGGINSACIAVSGSIVYVATAITDANNGGSNPYVWRNGVRTQLETQPGYAYHSVCAIVLE